MKKLIYIGIGILVIAVLFVFVWTWNSKEEGAPPETVRFPVSDTNGPDGVNEPPTAQSFLNDPDVFEDPANPGYYYLEYQPFSEDATQTPPYLIEYIAETQYFNIALTQEPLGQNRRTAEAYLQQKLGLSEQQMCALSYTVSVPYTVNEHYSSTNLGFSFCPGAVPLP